MNYLAFLLILGSFFLSSGCKRELCQSPPPTTRLLLLQADGNNAITASNAGRITIQHTNGGKLIPTGNFQVGSPSEYAIEAYELTVVSRRFSDTTHFYVSIDSKLFGMVQLKTYIDNSRCDGWTHISELQFNGRIVPFNNLKPGYTLTL